MNGSDAYGTCGCPCGCMNGADGPDNWCSRCRAGHYGTAAAADPAALQAALSCAVKACACFRMGLPRIGADALLSTSEMTAIAFPPGSAGAVALALVLDAVEHTGDDAEWAAIVAGLGAGTEDGR